MGSMWALYPTYGAAHAFRRAEPGLRTYDLANDCSDYCYDGFVFAVVYQHDDVYRSTEENVWTVTVTVRSPAEARA